MFGPIIAALIIAGGALVLALAVYLGTQIGEGARRRRIAERRRSSETGAFVTTAALTALPVILKSPTLRTVGIPLAALAAFMLLGRNGSDKAGRIGSRSGLLHPRPLSPPHKGSGSS